MLTAQQKQFVLTMMEHTDWPIEYADITWTEVKSWTRIVEMLNDGIYVRFRAPLDADGEQLQEGRFYTYHAYDKGKTGFKVNIDYENRTVKSEKLDFGFFSCPAFNKYYEKGPICNHRYFVSDARYAGGRLFQVQKSCALCGETSDWMTVHDEGDPIGHNGAMGVPGHNPKYKEVFWRWDFGCRKAKDDVWIDAVMDRERLFFGNYFSTEEACNKWAIMRGLKQD